MGQIDQIVANGLMEVSLDIKNHHGSVCLPALVQKKADTRLTGSDLQEEFSPRFFRDFEPNDRRLVEGEHS